MGYYSAARVDFRVVEFHAHITLLTKVKEGETKNKQQQYCVCESFAPIRETHTSGGP